MNIPLRLVLALIGVGLAATGVAAQDLSLYRDVQFGMNVAAVATHAGMDASNAVVVYERPAVIQELISRASRVGVGMRTEDDPVQDLVFTFVDNQLFRIVATYDRAKIAGLTDADLVDGLSAQYGAATTPPAAVTSARLSQSYLDTSEQVLARWEDDRFSVNLVRTSYGSSVALVMFSKALDRRARTAAAEAARLDALEAPAREAARQERSDADARAAEDKARLANKPTFRP